MTDTNTSDDETEKMPEPPNLDELFQSHTQNLADAVRKANSAFDAFKSRDQDVTALTQTLNTEVNGVFLLAAAAQTPQLAMASIPAVLALANAAFATVPVVGQKANIEITQAFKSAEL